MYQFYQFYQFYQILFINQTNGVYDTIVWCPKSNSNRISGRDIAVPRLTDQITSSIAFNTASIVVKYLLKLSSILSHRQPQGNARIN